MSMFLVTGGAGFIGSNIVRELLSRGENVRILDDFSTGRESNLNGIVHDIDIMRGDLCDPDVCRRAISGVDFVLHQGAVPSVQRSVSDPLRSHHTNATATLNLLVAARDADVQRFVYASSSSVYGDSPTMPKQEDMLPRPKSPYAVAKLAAESYCRIFYDLYGLETVSLRYFNVFGPRQDPMSPYSAVIPLFIRAMLAGDSPTIHGGGKQSRDFTYVANNVSANLLATTAPDVGGCVFNIACGFRYSLLDLVDNLNALLNTDIEPQFDASRVGDVKHSLADIRQAEEKLGYAVEVDFMAGLARAVDWYRANSD